MAQEAEFTVVDLAKSDDGPMCSHVGCCNRATKKVLLVKPSGRIYECDTLTCDRHVDDTVDWCMMRLGRSAAATTR
jgi:hypothetical protein